MSLVYSRFVASLRLQCFLFQSIQHLAELFVSFFIEVLNSHIHERQSVDLQEYLEKIQAFVNVLHVLLVRNISVRSMSLKIGKVKKHSRNTGRLSFK